MTRPSRRRLGATLSAALLCAGCVSGGRLPDAVAGSVVPPDDNSVSYPACTADEAAANNPLSSFAPLDSLPSPEGPFDDETLQEIFERGTLRVGISADTLLFGARNLEYVAGNAEGRLAYEGFDIDVVTQVALAIFGGDQTTIGSHIEFVAIPYRDRIPKLQSGEVDVVAHTMTINCTRWKQIAFSAEYFRAGQRVLVLKGSSYDGIDALAAAGASVCVPDGSTNQEALALYPEVDAVTVVDISDCLVLLQQGSVAAITGDDTVLAGLAVQDPATVVVGEQFTEEPYGLGIAADRVDFVRFVNAVLVEMVDDGRWESLYEKWLVPLLAAEAPAAPDQLHDRPLP
ncbi:MAG: transporter substrate-binding domain-containing protein [Actinomycetota bacterium]|nr:transporter substrate-binding domain-containing protein [Actinomycetota bacterium]